MSLTNDMASPMNTMSFHEDGFAVIDDLVSSLECDNLAAHVNSISQRSAGCRCLLNYDWCRDASENIRTRMTSELDFVPGSVIVQCTYFHKTAEKNWLVAWHQDRSILVDSQVESTDLTGWSRKEGMIFVHAPDVILSEMFAVRLHLDNSTPHNGPLRIIPGSHRNGTLSTDQVEHAHKNNSEMTCLVRKGGVLVIRPLLLHASSKSNTMEPRRVLHFLFGPKQLPYGLAWRRAV